MCGTDTLHPTTEIRKTPTHLWSFHHQWQRFIHEISWWNSRNTIFRNCSLTNSLRRLHSFVGKRTSRQECGSGSNHPAEAMPWMKEVEMANSVDDLKTSRSVFGRQNPSFETLNERIATALKNIIQNSNLKGKVHSEEQKAQKEN